MINRDDILYFYSEYKKNLNEEASLSEFVFRGDSMEEVLENTKKKQEDIRVLYEKNVELLNKYLYPLINGEQSFTDEIIDTVLDETYKFCVEGHSDSLVGIYLLQTLEQHFESLKNKDSYLDKIILLYHLLGYFCNHAIENSEGPIKGKEYYHKTLKYLDNYFEIESARTRKTLIISLQNYCTEHVNYCFYMLDKDKEMIYEYQQELVDAVEDAIAFYNDTRVRQLDGEAIDFDVRIRKLKQLTYGNVIGDMASTGIFKECFLNYARKYLEELYDFELKQNADIFQMNENIYCGYWVCRYIMKEISIDDFLEKYLDYCITLAEKDERPDEGDFFESKYFNICNNKIPLIFYYINDGEISEIKREEVTALCVEKYLEMMEYMPSFSNSARVNEALAQSSKIIVKYLPPHIPKYNFLIKILIGRDGMAMLHAVMVRQLSYIILHEIFEEKPELLIGVLDTESVMDVLNKQDEIVDYIRKASLLFDIGKVFVSELIQKETRPLVDDEFERIRRHPEMGCKIIENVTEIGDFVDVVMGHHKYYDGSMGYPEQWDNSNSKVKFITDLITICDCMDAATDNIGRNYKMPKKFMEFIAELKEGAGTKYNPDIVELICTSKKIKNDLQNCCVVQRERVYLETYFEFINKEEAEYSTSDEEKSTLPIWTKSALRVMEIDFYRDYIKTIYSGAASFIHTVKDGKFSTYAGEHLEKIFHPQDLFKINRLFDFGTLADKLNVNNGTFEQEVRIRKADDWMWIRLQFLVSVEHFGIPQKILIIISDADEQCRKRQKMQETLEQAQEAAKTADKAKTMFISNISHEIRTPMNAIVGMVEILLRTNLDDTQKEYLNNIKNSGNALLTIINDILDFSKMESGKFEIIESEYDLINMLNEISMIFLNRIGEKPVELIYDIDKNIPKTLYGDSLRFRQVIINLMNNAIKFTDQGMVMLKIKVNQIVDDQIELLAVVKDSGIGIKEEDIGKLFGQFQQIDVKKNYEKEGTGLGLVISKQLVGLMGGSISVSSVYGEGSEFTFTVKQKIMVDEPAISVNHERINDSICIGYMLNDKYIAERISELCDAYGLASYNYYDIKSAAEKIDIVFTDYINLSFVRNAVEKNTEICVLQNPMIENLNIEDCRVINKPLFTYNFCQVLNHEKEQVFTNDSNAYFDFVAPKAKILIVDDTEMNLTVAKGLLQPLNMQIDTANSGMKAIEMIQSKDYDIVFMDHKMPDMDGIDTTVCIRTMEDDYYRTVPIIALTANAVLEARQSFADAGMNDFVAKPIEIKDITQKIKKWLKSELIEKASANNTINVSEQQQVPSDISIPGLNIEEGLKNAGGFELFATLVCDYYKLIDSKSNKIRDYLAEGMIKEYTVEVHAMKSVSRVIGALELSEHFKELEALGDKEDVDALYEKTPKVLEEYMAYKDYLKEFVTQRESLKGKDEISNDELLEIIETMKGAMQSCDLDMVDECMNRLDNCKIPVELSELMEKLSVYIADVAMEESINIMTQMSEKLK